MAWGGGGAHGHSANLLLPQQLRIRDMMLTLERAIKGLHRDYTPGEHSGVLYGVVAKGASEGEQFTRV